MSDLSKAAALADEEARQVAERKDEIRDVAMQVEALLVEHGVTFVEWQSICAMFMDRQMTVAERMTLKEVKERFDSLT